MENFLKWRRRIAVGLVLLAPFGMVNYFLCINSGERALDESTVMVGALFCLWLCLSAAIRLDELFLGRLFNDLSPTFWPYGLSLLLFLGWLGVTGGVPLGEIGRLVPLLRGDAIVFSIWIAAWLVADLNIAITYILFYRGKEPEKNKDGSVTVIS